MSIPEAGRHFFDLGRSASYSAAKNGFIPTINLGTRKRAIVAAIEERLLQAANESTPGND